MNMYNKPREKQSQLATTAAGPRIKICNNLHYPAATNQRGRTNCRARKASVQNNEYAN